MIACFQCTIQRKTRSFRHWACALREGGFFYDEGTLQLPSLEAGEFKIACEKHKSSLQKAVLLTSDVLSDATSASPTGAQFPHGNGGSDGAAPMNVDVDASVDEAKIPHESKEVASSAAMLNTGMARHFTPFFS